MDQLVPQRVVGSIVIDRWSGNGRFSWTLGPAHRVWWGQSPGLQVGPGPGATHYFKCCGRTSRPQDSSKSWKLAPCTVQYSTVRVVHIENGSSSGSGKSFPSFILFLLCLCCILEIWNAEILYKSNFMQIGNIFSESRKRETMKMLKFEK